MYIRCFCNYKSAYYVFYSIYFMSVYHGYINAFLIRDLTK